MIKTCKTSLVFSSVERTKRQFIGKQQTFNPLSRGAAKLISHAGLPSCFFGLCLAWLGLFANLFSATGAVTAATSENIRLFADARRITPKNLFHLGETVWAVGTGMSISKQQLRCFKWIAPDGNVTRQSDVVADNQMDAFRIPPSAQVGTWTVKTVDQTNSGYAVATFIVRDPHPAKAVVNLSVIASGPTQVSAGQQIHYELNVVNNGPNDAQNVKLSAEMANGAVFQSLTEASGWTCKRTGAENTNTCTIPLLASGATAVFKLNYQVEESVASNATISHTASIASQTNESHEIDNTVLTTATVEQPGCALGCPANITQSRDSGKSGAVVHYTDPTASAESCNMVDCNPTSGSFFPAGITTVVCSSLASRECSFKVRVTGAVAITLNGPEKILVERHQQYTDPGVTARDDNNTPLQVITSGVVDLQRLGTYSLTYTATDGTHTATVTRVVQVVDTTPPQLTCPTNIIARLAPGTAIQSSVVNFSLLATDSGEPVPVTTVPASGSNFPIGTTTVEAKAMDAAGNQHACKFAVTMLYRFTGTPSFDGSRESILAQAGNDIPVKFSLSGNKGFNIFAPGYPVTAITACNPTPNFPEVQNVGAAQHKLFSYDPIADQYTYFWKTETSWAGTCRQLMFKFTDGAEFRTNFAFK